MSLTAEDQVVPGSDDGPVSTRIFNIQAADLFNELSFGLSLRQKWLKVAEEIGAALKKTKMNDKCDYKNLKYWQRKNVEHPLIGITDVVDRTSSTQPQFSWTPPKQVNVLFEQTSSCCAQRSFSNIAEVFVEVPESLFGKRDFVNIVYAVKRGHFMCSCLAKLRNLFPKLDFTLSFEADRLFPDIIVTEKDSDSSAGIRLCFYATESGLAKPSRFNPSAGNLRPATVLPHSELSSEVATPLFNQRTLRTMVVHSLRHSIETELRLAEKEGEKLRVALFLIRLWFENRELPQFDSLLLSGVMLHLLREGVVAFTHDITTTVKNFFTAIVGWDNCSDSLIGLNTVEISPDQLSAYRKAFPAVFLDTSGYFNMAHKVTLDSLKKAKALVSHSLPLLGDPSHFNALFVEESSFSSSFDHYMRLECSRSQLLSISKKDVTDCVDCRDLAEQCIRIWKKIFREAMGERFEYFEFKIVKGFGKQAESMTNSGNASDKVVFSIGFKSTTQWTNPITVGPIANDPAAKAFRSFWRGSSQLRKFADTRICECMIWAETPSLAIPLTIARFVLEKHFGLSNDCIGLRSLFPSTLAADRTTQSTINEAFSSLNGILRSLKGLPLMVTNIHGVSPYLRGTEPLCSSVLSSNEGALHVDHRLPSHKRIPKYTPAVDVFVKLEYSGKWGNDYEGIKRLTAAFYIQIAEQLTNKEMIAVATMEQLYIVKDSVVFRVVIVQDKVFKLLESEVNQLVASAAPSIESSKAGRRLQQYQKKYIAEVLLQSSLQSFAKKHEVFGGTVQLMKRWLAAKLLSDVIPDLALEIIVAAAIETSNKCYPYPETVWAAFRRCLHLISTHNWARKPLIVDFHNVWKEDNLADLEKSFVKMRPILPPMVLITNEDTTGMKWTRESPSPLLLKRVIGLSSSTLKVLDEHLFDALPVDMGNLLLSVDDSAYDVVLHLHSKYITRTIEASTTGEIKGLPVVNFDPIGDFFASLEANFHSVAIFFFDKYGGERIGIKFKPNEDRIPAKISRCGLRSFSSVGDVLNVNKDEVLEGIEILGKGLIREVVKRY